MYVHNSKLIRANKTRSPEDFIRYLCTQLRFPSKEKQVGRRKPEFISHLIDLYHKQQGVCAVSGIVMTNGSQINGSLPSPFQLSIDRIDNGRGYEIGNVRLCCLWCNRAMASWGLPTLHYFVHAIALSGNSSMIADVQPSIPG